MKTKPIEISPAGVVACGEILERQEHKPRGKVPCPRCGRGHRIVIPDLGWVCSRCFEVCRRVIENDETLQIIKNLSIRQKTTLELAVELYRKVERHYSRCVACGKVAGPDGEDFGEGRMCSPCAGDLAEKLGRLLQEAKPDLLTTDPAAKGGHNH